MNLSIGVIVGLLFLMWMIYFSLGAFANMTEDKTLLNIFKLFKYIIAIASILLVAIYVLNL